MVVKQAVYTDIAAQNRPSFFATPVAWAAADFTAVLVQAAGGIVAPSTGLIVTSDKCSLATIRDLARTAAQGTISPLRFAGASPSIVAGLPALRQGIRGPTLALTMSPDHAADAMIAIIDYWFSYSSIVTIIAVVHYRPDERQHLFRGLIASAAGADLRHQLRQLCLPPADAQTGQV